MGRKVLRLRSGFRLRAPASLTPAQRLKFESRLAHHLRFIPIALNWTGLRLLTAASELLTAAGDQSPLS